MCSSNAPRMEKNTSALQPFCGRDATTFSCTSLRRSIQILYLNGINAQCFHRTFSHRIKSGKGKMQILSVLPSVLADGDTERGKKERARGQRWSKNFGYIKQGVAEGTLTAHQSGYIASASQKTRSLHASALHALRAAHCSVGERESVQVRITVIKADCLLIKSCVG